MIKFMQFVNKCIKTNSIMNDDDDGVSDCDAYYITACCTENIQCNRVDNATYLPITFKSPFTSITYYILTTMKCWAILIYTTIC